MNIRRMSSAARVKLIIGVLLILGVVAIGFWLMSSNHGTVVETSDRAVKHGPSTQTFDGINISFTYKSIYSVATVKAADNDLEMYNLTANTNYEKHLAVAVSKLPGGALDDYGSYSNRKLRTDLYSHQDVTVDGDTAVLFTKNDNLEHTVFIPHNDKVTTLSFVSASPYDDVPSEITALLTTFRWKL